jgi:imidazolonepropionase-like amidohydrolase
MPGLVDAFGHLGLEGSDKTPDSDFNLARLLEPGDWTDRRVARAGVTTVVMAPRGSSRGGAPMMAYKPAASDLEQMVVEDPAALRVSWSDARDRNKSGEDVRKLLEKVVEYDKKWKEYDQAMSEWVPPAADEAAAEEDADDEAKEDGDADEDADEDEDEGKQQGKRKGEGDEEGDPLTGVWDGELVVPPAEEASKLRLRVGNESGRVSGTLRCAALSDTLVIVSGSFEDGHVDLTGLGSKGYVRLAGDVKKGELEGTVTFGGEEHELECERTSREYVVAGRSEVRKQEQEDAKEPKGKPKSPGIDEKLEPLRAALRGEKRVVVDVDRSDEILECVQAFEDAGIAPVLFGADDAWRVVDELRGRVSGVLLRGGPVRGDERDGLAGWRNPYQELSSAGIPVAFHSSAEEGASELWIQAAYAVSLGLSPSVAMRALTSGSAQVMGIEERVGTLAPGMDGDVLLLDGPPLDASTSVERVWVAGEEVR